MDRNYVPAALQNICVNVWHCPLACRCFLIV